MSPPADLVNATLGPQALPRLQRIDAARRKSDVSPPIKRIQSDADLQHWRRTKAYRDIALFVSRLAEASVGKETRWPSTSSPLSRFEGVQAVLDLLLELRQWTRDIEPRSGAQRFGNLAFRDWGARLEERCVALHEKLLAGSPHLVPYIPELAAYLNDSFGSFVRIDYGSGHEVNFAAWLAYLFRLGCFGQTDGDDEELALPSAVESDLALLVFPLYLEVVWSLQDRYGLEPAGSHGVWGLDDYHFIPYAIGAAQLRQQSLYKPSQISLPSHKPPSSRTSTTSTDAKISPAELLAFVPVKDPIPPPFANLFTSSIARIHALKTGPFFEHSPLLYDISTSVPNWRKVSSGMLKMWDNEVMGKRPVVQHFVFGGVGYVWDDIAEGEAPSDGRAQSATSVPRPTSNAVPTMTTAAAPTTTPAPTGAPWAATPRPPPTSTMPPTAASWARSVPSTAATARSLPPLGSQSRLGQPTQQQQQSGGSIASLPPLLSSRRPKAAQQQQRQPAQPNEDRTKSESTQ